MKYAKYHGLGNDYLVISPHDIGGDLDLRHVQLICDRNYGIGSDGILLGPLHSEDYDFRLRILNPDGSEAEKSGNGLQVFSRNLWYQGLVYEDTFTIETLGRAVVCQVHNGGKTVTVEMGEISFLSTKIPVAGVEREVLREHMDIGSSSTASAGVAHRLNLCDPAMTVHMPGGKLSIHISPTFSATMTGPVMRVCEGVMDPEMFEEERASDDQIQRT